MKWEGRVSTNLSGIPVSVIQHSLGTCLEVMLMTFLDVIYLRYFPAVFFS